MGPSNTSAPLGAYGFRLNFEGEPALFPDLVPVSAEAATVSVTCRLGAALQTRDDVSDDRVEMMTQHGAHVIVRREPPATDLIAPVPLSPEALVHPMLTMPFSVLSRWRGDVALHGGAFVHAGGAWGVIGERTAGKSTLLALLG